MRCVARTSALRCAYCHDGLQAPSWACERCSTHLHADCFFELAGLCPILGCRPRIFVRVRAAGSSWCDLACWLASYVLLCATLTQVVPRVTKIFVRKKASLPVPTRAFMDLASFASSNLGLLLALSIAGFVVASFLRKRDRAGIGIVLGGLTLLNGLLIAICMFFVFLPLASAARV